MTDAMTFTTAPVLLGLIGCGNISDTYFNRAARSQRVRIKACADLNPEAAAAKAAQHGVQAMSVEQLLADPEIEIVINLTVPLAHAAVAQQVLAWPTTASSGWWTWPWPCAKAGRTAPAASWPCMCWRCWMLLADPRQTAGM